MTNNDFMSEFWHDLPAVALMVGTPDCSKVGYSVCCQCDELGYHAPAILVCGECRKRYIQYCYHRALCEKCLKKNKHEF